jgi:hypothetical protein
LQTSPPFLFPFSLNCQNQNDIHSRMFSTWKHNMLISYFKSTIGWGRVLEISLPPLIWE